MISDLNFKNISTEDLKDYTQYSSLGVIGVTFFSKPFKSVNFSLLEFLYNSHNKVDSLFVIAHKDCLSEEETNILSLLPYVSFVYTADNLDNFFNHIKCSYFFKAPDQDFPQWLDKSLQELEDCKIA